MAELEKTDPIDTTKLTQDAEGLKGCSIMESFKGHSLQAQLTAMRDIHAQHKAHRYSNGNLPDLFVEWKTTDTNQDSSTHGQYENHVILSITKHIDDIWQPDIELFKEDFDINGKITYQCKDIDSASTKQRQDETKY